MFYATSLQTGWFSGTDWGDLRDLSTGWGFLGDHSLDWGDLWDFSTSLWVLGDLSFDWWFLWDPSSELDRDFGFSWNLTMDCGFFS